MSNYDVAESNTSKQTVQDNTENPRDIQKIFGTVNFVGAEYTDKMCLY